MRWLKGLARALLTAVAEAVKDPAPDEPASSEPERETRWLPRLSGLDKTTPEFRRQLIRTSDRLEIDVDHLAAVIWFETAGTWSPTVRNQTSGAIGLLQWLPPAADYCRTSIGELAQMSAVEQLAIVERFFWAYKGKLKALEQVYVLVLAGMFLRPPKSGSWRDVPLFKIGSKAYAQNYRLDKDNDGVVTVSDACRNLHHALSSTPPTRRIKVEM